MIMFNGGAQITGDEWEGVVKAFKQLSKVPSEPHQQLEMAIQAVFSSWYDTKTPCGRSM
jgi:hypothetical protein